MTLNEFGEISKLNSDKQDLSAVRGNAMIYVILALALLGGLTMLLMKQGSESSDLTYEQSELLTTKTVAIAASAKNIVDQMTMSGSPIASLSFLKPDDAGFDTAPHIHKVFHPEGGGFSLPVPDSALFTGTDAAPKPGWYMGRFNNIEWTPTAANDILFVAYDISAAACAAINKKITGTTTIPVVTGSTTEQFFVNVFYGGGANANFMEANCATCKGYPSLCGASTGNTTYTYYNIISGQ